MDKRSIIAEIRRLAEANGGRAPGRERFEKETGIRMHEWYPNLWLRWGDALQEAGLSPNKLNVKLEHEHLLGHYANLVKELGRVPLDGEVRLKAKKDKSFPSHSVFSRFGGKAKLLAALREHSKDRPEILSLLPSSTVKAGTDGTVSKSRKFDVGYVYLMKSGRHFKIGRSNSVGRREWELGIKIPIPPSTIHSIETDDPPGVEAYWHRRFAGKRGEGEWFNLTADDIAAFKRWKRIA